VVVVLVFGDLVFFDVVFISFVNDFELLVELMVLVLDDYYEVIVLVVYEVFVFLFEIVLVYVWIVLMMCFDLLFLFVCLCSNGVFVEVWVVDLCFMVEEIDILLIILVNGSFVLLRLVRIGVILWIMGLSGY